MQNEDDLRGLAKTMDLMRAIAILFTAMHAYWFCYAAFRDRQLTLEVVDTILLNFDRSTGLFASPLWTKLFATVFLSLSCLGTKGVRTERITWPRVGAVAAAGTLLFFLNGWTLRLPIGTDACAGLYLTTLAAGFVCLLMAESWASRLLKNNLMDDVFNVENESFMQETRLMTNEYSVNLPTRFYYRKKWQSGWINVVNPFRATMVLGTPGSGKSYAIVNNYIKQQIEKGVDGKTVDGFSVSHIEQLIDTLKNETYQPKPSQRVYIPKKNGKKRPLGIPSFTDKLLQEVVRMILEAIYEGSSDNFDERIEQKIFHAEIVVDVAKVSAETKAYQPIPLIADFTNENGSDSLRETIEANYRQVKQEVLSLVDSETARIKADPTLRNLLRE